jgi:hypothetical protein
VNINTEAAQLPVLSRTDEHIDRQGDRSKSHVILVELQSEDNELSDPVGETEEQKHAAAACDGQTVSVSGERLIRYVL